MSAAPTTTEGVITLARTTPLVRRAVEDLAKKVPGPLAAKAAEEALDTAGAPAALVLAFAAIAAGAKIAPLLTRALLPEVLSLDQVGPLVYATEGGPLDVLLAFLEDKYGDLELECLALLLASEELSRVAKEHPSRALPPSLLTRARWLARHKLNEDAGLFLGGAAMRLGDASLSSLASRDVNRAKRNKRVIEETLAVARAPVVESLPEVDGSRVSSGFTVKNTAPAVGRNDPCPCGSGKKYKKCHALETAAPLAAPAAAPAIDAATLGPDQAALLRPSEIASLDTARLSPRAFVEAFRRVVDFRQWDLAVRMIGEAKKVGSDPVPLVLDALHGAYEAGARDAAEKLYALLPDTQAAREAFALECVRRQPDLLDRIEREAEEALRNDADGGRGMLFAASLLRWFPALGVYVARGALHEGRVADSQALLERIEDARDRLLLSPHEAWWDVFEAFFAEPEESSARKDKKEDAKRAKLKEDLRLARASSRKLAVEMEKLKTRVAELDETMAAPTSTRSSRSAPVAPDPTLADERRRLKTKIDELVRIIGEGQDERRELRRQLAERDAREDDSGKPSERDDEDDGTGDEPDPDEGAGVDVPRIVLVPRFSERAAKTLADLAAEPAAGVLEVVAALAAGKPNAWSGVKQLTKIRGVLSARAGIHHRVLFTTDAPGRQLDVLEVLHRKDLEQVVARLARAGVGS